MYTLNSLTRVKYMMVLIVIVMIMGASTTDLNFKDRAKEKYQDCVNIMDHLLE